MNYIMHKKLRNPKLGCFKKIFNQTQTALNNSLEIWFWTVSNDKRVILDLAKHVSDL